MLLAREDRPKARSLARLRGDLLLFTGAASLLRGREHAHVMSVRVRVCVCVKVCLCMTLYVYVLRAERMWGG